MSQGIKNYGKYYETSFSGVRSLVNLCKQNANLNFVIPIYESNLNNPVNLSLVFSLADISKLSEFGKGVRLSYYKKINTPSSGKIIVENSDFSFDEYIQDENDTSKYVNVETGNYIIYHTQTNVSLYDKYQNKVFFNPISINYPSYLYKKSLDTNTLITNYTSTNKLSDIYSSDGEKATFIYTNNLVTTINITRTVNDVENMVLQVKLLYDGSNRLTSIEYISQYDTTKKYTISITYTGNIGINISNSLDSSVSNFTYSLLTIGTNVVPIISKVESGVGTTYSLENTTINYYDRYSEVTDYRGNMVRYFFTENGMPLYEVDGSGNAQHYYYSNKLLTYMGPIIINDKEKVEGNIITYGFDVATSNMFLENATVTAENPTGQMANLYSSKLGNSVYKVTNNSDNNQDGYVYAAYGEKGSSEDGYTFSIWFREYEKVTNVDIIAKALIYFCNGNKRINKEEIIFTSSNTPIWEFKSVSAKADTKFDRIILELHVYGNGNSCLFDGISLIRKSLSLNRVYDGNKVVISNQNIYEYNEDNLVSKEYQANGRTISYTYDDKQNLIKKEVDYTSITEYEYDDKNNCIKEKIMDLNTNEYIELTREYNPNATSSNLKGQFLTKEVNDNNKVTNYSWDKLYKLLTQVNSSDGTISKYRYNQGWKQISELIVQTSTSTNQTKIKYDYNSDETINKVILKDGTYGGDSYSFIYNSNKQLESIRRNSSILTKFTYEDVDGIVGNISTKQYGYGNIYYMEYDNLGRLISVSLKEDSSSYASTSIANYEYDILSRLIKVTYNGGMGVVSYTYDSQGRVSTVTDKEYGETNETVTYSYNSNNYVSGIKTTDRYQTFARNNNSIVKNAVTLSKGIRHISSCKIESDIPNDQKVYSCLLNDEEPLKLLYYYSNIENPAISSQSYLPLYEVNGIGKEKNIVYLENTDTSGYLCYDIPQVDSIYPITSVSYWFKPVTQQSDMPHLLHIGGKEKNNIKIRINSGKIEVKIIDNIGRSLEVFTTSSNIVENEWNYFAFSILSRSDSTPQTTYNLKLNDESLTSSIYKSDYDLRTTDGSNIYIGYSDNDNELSKLGSKLIGKISCLQVSTNTGFSLSEMKRRYFEERELLFGFLHYENLFYSVTNQIEVSDYSERSTFDMIALNQDFISYKGKEPIILGELKYTYNHMNNYFVYLDNIGRYCYYAGGNELVYDYELSTDGSISMNCYIGSINGKSYLFENKDNNGNKFGLYRNSNKELIVEFEGINYSTNIFIENKIWTKVGMSWSYNEGTYLVKVTSYATKTLEIISNITPTTKKTSIGRSFDSDENALFGYIDGVVICSGYSPSVLGLNINKITTNKVTSNLGLPLKKTLKDNEGIILENEYTYLSLGNNRISSTISTEKIGDDTYQYIYYDNGNLKEIKKNGSRKAYFEYDYRGYITKEINPDYLEANYTYDYNGNITQKEIIRNYIGTELIEYEYDYYNPFILTSVNDAEITYDTANRNPETYGDITYTWEGDRLKTYSLNDEVFSYFYNDKGLRKIKITSDSEIHYFYEGSKLIKEKVTKDYQTTYRYYYYDESEQLYGIKYNDQMYYYVRNIFGDILGLVDTSGNSVVEYDYNSWGEILNISGTLSSTLGNDNPFRYKGYYYDVETQLYWVSSRYYSPELCRWISPDSIEYLDPESINGLNLYAYCGNDPINKYDPTGHIAISTLVLIIVGAAVLTTAGAITYGAVTDTPVVLDFSVSAGMGAGVGGKVGMSIVLDFKNDSFGFYPHYGYYYGAKYNTFGFSYSVGLISNYENEGDYAGPFVDFGGGFYGGIDHCYDPRYPYDNTVRASSITFGNNIGAYYGYDYYDYWGSISFDKVVEFLKRGVIIL